MKACATASAIGGVALASAFAIGACRSDKPAADVPPVTTATPPPTAAVISGPVEDAAVVPAVPVAPEAGAGKPVEAAFVDAPTSVEDAGRCTTTILAVVKGNLTVVSEVLAPGDAIVLRHARGLSVEGKGLFVRARAPIEPCDRATRAVPQIAVIRATAAPKLEWAGGKMSAHLDVGTKASPDLYLGRLAGTAAVGEHVHPGSWEIVAAVEAAGTFTLDGKEQRLGPRQVVLVPPGAKHAWKPDPGSKLVAVQMYAPPGPEQRFVALAEAEKDAGKR